MSHNVETMMYVGDTPWHGLGTYVGDEAVTSEQAIVQAGLDWEVELRPLFADGAHHGPILCEDNKAVVRQSDGSVLGVVGNRYRPVQNAKAFEFFDSLTGQKLAMYHTAGSLRDGRLIWILAKLPGTIRVVGHDIVEKYLLLFNSHDGTHELKMMYTPVRVVCNNTLNMALADFKRGANCIGLRHTANLEQRLEAAAEALGLADQYYKEFEVKAQFLADQRFTDLQLDQAMRKAFGVKADTKKEDIATRTKNNMEKVRELFETGQGIADMPLVKGTAWGAYNAMTEYADHFRVVKNESQANRVESNWLGSSAAFKQKALHAIEQTLAA